jgi:hypothetical protein
MPTRPIREARRLDVGLDVDGVLYPFAGVIATYASQTLGRPCSPDAETWDWYRHQWGLTTDDFLNLCARSVRDGVLFTQGEPLPGALDALRELSRAGHRLHYISARALPGVPPESVSQSTAQWLRRWEFPDGSITISDNKACRPTDVFLDDSPHLYDALVAAGHPRPILWSHPCTEGHAAERVYSWAEFLEIVDELAQYVDGT